MLSELMLLGFWKLTKILQKSGQSLFRKHQLHLGKGSGFVVF